MSVSKDPSARLLQLCSSVQPLAAASGIGRPSWPQAHAVERSSSAVQRISYSGQVMRCLIRSVTMEEGAAQLTKLAAYYLTDTLWPRENRVHYVGYKSIAAYSRCAPTHERSLPDLMISCSPRYLSRGSSCAITSSCPEKGTNRGRSPSLWCTRELRIW